MPHLTNFGLAERAELDRRSNELALRILDPLSEHQRETLLAAMKEVERLLQASTKLSPVDRLFWTVLRRIWSGRSEALIIVKPDTVVRWHRTG